MVHYFCYRCGYETSQKINLKHHLNRKKICKPILEDISIEDVKKHYNFEINEIHSKHLKRHSTIPKLLPQTTSIYTQNNTQIII